MKALCWIIALCGLWEAGDIAALLVPNFGPIPAYLWNHVVVGILLIIAGVWAALTSRPAAARALLWASAALGAWLVAASFLLGRPMQSAGLWNDVIVGAIVALLGLWAARTAPAAGA